MRCKWKEQVDNNDAYQISYKCDVCDAVVSIPRRSLMLRFDNVDKVFDLLADCGSTEKDRNLAFREAMKHGTNKMIATLKAEMEAKKNPKPEPRSLSEKIDGYEKEHEEWVKAGKPTRNRRRRAQLYNICAMCENYTGKTCKICGCMINLTPGLNKLYWATTKCPLDPPKWEADWPDTKEESDPEEAALVDSSPVNKPPKKSGGCGCGGK